MALTAPGVEPLRTELKYFEGNTFVSARSPIKKRPLNGHVLGVMTLDFTS